MDLSGIQNLGQLLKTEVAKVIVGQDEAVDLFLISLLCQGHILLEGPPGTAKTLLSQTIAASLGLQFGRIQFTPDLMPGDVLGTNLFDFRANQFSFKRGPIFTELLLADEINRTPPKTQSALLQAMQERVVTIDGETRELSDGFIVVATQNPIEHHGTYPLPEAQLDRFLIKHLVTYPSRDEECAIVKRQCQRVGTSSLAELRPVLDLRGVQEVRRAMGQVRLADEVGEYIVDVVRETRRHPSLQVGASPRCTAMIASASRACAALGGRDFVIPDDVKYIAKPCLRHRVILAARAEIDNIDPDAVIRQILDEVAAPR